MLNLTWIKNPDHVSYCKENEVLPRLARELGIADLAQQVEEFRTHPTAEGVNLKGKKRTTLKLFIPNLTFPEPVEMGENVWIYMGSCAPACCLFTLGRQKRIDATGRRWLWADKKILGRGKNLCFLYQQGVRILPLPPGAEDGVQLPVLLLPALYAGAEVRGKLHLFGKRRQGLQQVPGTPPPGELWIYCRQFPEDCWRDGGTGRRRRTVNEGSSLPFRRCTWKKRPTAMRRRALLGIGSRSFNR